MQALKRAALVVALGLGGFAVAVSPALVPTAQAHDPKPDKPPKPKDTRKLAGELCKGAMAGGAYATLTAADLAAYCVELAMALDAADYEPAGP